MGGNHIHHFLESILHSVTPSRVWQQRSAVVVLAIVFIRFLLAGRQPSAPTDVSTSKSDQFLQHYGQPKARSASTAIIARLAEPSSPRQERDLRSLGGVIYRHLPLIHSVALRLPARNLTRLASLPFVLHLSEDAVVTKKDEFTVNSSGSAQVFGQYHLTGQGVSVAVVDSGIHAHTDLTDVVTGASSILAEVNFVAAAQNADDQYGHGTHVAGIIAGNGAASSGRGSYHTFYGIARRARLVSVRVLDALGNGDVSTTVAGIQWVVANKSRYNIRVLNLSLGHSVGESYTTDPLCQAVEQAWKAGIVVVCAAGNDGRQNAVALPFTDNEGYGTALGSIVSPGNDPYVITVGAMKSTDGNRAHDRIATYSSRGPSRLDMVVKPDLVAPGNKVISLLRPAGTLEVTQGIVHDVAPATYITNPPLLAAPTYFQMSGTSMAAPVVAGAAALLLEANPGLSPDTIKARLMISADRWCFADGTTDACTFGAGYLNIPSALNCQATPSHYALSPTLTRDGQGNVTLNLDTLVWGTQGLWGAQILGGTQALWTDSALWSTSVVIALPILQDER